MSARGFWFSVHMTKGDFRDRLFAIVYMAAGARTYIFRVNTHPEELAVIGC